MNPLRAFVLAACLGVAWIGRAAEGDLPAVLADGFVGADSGVGFAPAAITLTGLNQTYDGLPGEVVVATNPENLAVRVAYDGSPDVPTDAGLYSVVAVVTAPGYTGSATGTLVIAKAVATVGFGGLVQRYDGAPKDVGVVTSPGGLDVTMTYNGDPAPPTAPGAYLVEAEVIDDNYTGVATDAFVIDVTAVVRHAPLVFGAIDGSLQVLSNENFSLGGGAWLSGDLLVPGLPGVHVTGRPVYAGTEDGSGGATPGDYEVTLESNALLRHVVRRTDPAALPAVAPPPAPGGTRDVEIANDTPPVGDFASVRDFVLNAESRAIAIPPGAYGRFAALNGGSFIVGTAGTTEPAIYYFQSLKLAGGSRLEVDGPAILVVAGGMSVDQTAGDAAHPEWLTVEISGGGLVLNSGQAVFNGSVVAPHGMVVIGDNAVLNGTVAADRLIVSSNGLLKDSSR